MSHLRNLYQADTFLKVMQAIRLCINGKGGIRAQKGCTLPKGLYIVDPEKIVAHFEASNMLVYSRIKQAINTTMSYLPRIQSAYSKAALNNDEIKRYGRHLIMPEVTM